jgi:alanine-synthesizing transaminase
MAARASGRRAPPYNAGPKGRPKMLFSRRTPADLAENPLTRALKDRAAPFVDLTLSNPTVAGLSPSEEEIRDALSAGGSSSYAPHPRGTFAAREAVSAYYRERSASISPERIVLTASTSEAYGFLFKLIGDPGDRLLVPEPSYPLFDHLIRLEALSEMPYALRRSPLDGHWRVDFASVERGLDAGVRAMLSVHPNNPTGNFVTDDERRQIGALLDPARHAVISDEVFLDFPVEDVAEKAGVVAAASDGPLAFSLGGLSKSCALPQMKLAWIAVGGEPAAVTEALERLDLIADTYLSVATPVQRALPKLFEAGARASDRIRERLRRNLGALDRALAGLPSASRFPVEGGWSAVVRLPPPEPDRDLALFLLDRAGVLVQPGWFFNFGGDDLVVLSLLPEPGIFDEGMARIVSAFSARG